MEKENKTIWTIGHSTRSFEEFLEMLHSFSIELIADVRSYPGSRRFPQFNKEALEVSLPQDNIQYAHLKNLGGRRKANPDSKNTAWRHAAFRGYADYMETNIFKDGALSEKTKQLIAVAVAHVTQCPYCIHGHTAQALRKGASEQEIMEAFWVAAEMRAGGSYAHAALAIDEMKSKEKAF